jgi:hypothetical protein
VHLNQRGVEKFHKGLVTWLQETKVLPEPRHSR